MPTAHSSEQTHSSLKESHTHPPCRQTSPGDGIQLSPAGHSRSLKHPSGLGSVHDAPSTHTPPAQSRVQTHLPPSQVQLEGMQRPLVMAHVCPFGHVWFRQPAGFGSVHSPSLPAAPLAPELVPPPVPLSVVPPVLPVPPVPPVLPVPTALDVVGPPLVVLLEEPSVLPVLALDSVEGFAVSVLPVVVVVSVLELPLCVVLPEHAPTTPPRKSIRSLGPTGQSIAQPGVAREDPGTLWASYTFSTPWGGFVLVG